MSSCGPIRTSFIFTSISSPRINQQPADFGGLRPPLPNLKSGRTTPKAFKKSTGFMLNPFAGVDTMFVQAAEKECRVVGFANPPYTRLSANVKLNAMKFDTRELEQATEKQRTR